MYHNSYTFFSVLCIRVSDSFFKKLNTLFFKFIWNGGNDRVKRANLCLDYSSGGLRMVNPYIFAQAQKMIWVKYLLDDNYDSMWKSIEIHALKSFHPDSTILWKSHAPEKILSDIKNVQVVDSLRAWYFFRDKAIEDLGINVEELRIYPCMWFNKHVRLKSKSYFYYESWYEKGIFCLADLLYKDTPTPVLKSFDDLIIEFDISYKDRRKYNSLMKSIVERGLVDDASEDQLEPFEIFSSNLILAPKVPRYTYSIMLDKSSPSKATTFWENQFNDTVDWHDLEWEDIHNRNFKCTIETQLRSFYFKIFHRAIAFNDFLFKIGRKDSPLCSMCHKDPETIIHVFCECDIVKPIWVALQNLINAKLHSDYDFNHFDYIFGISSDTFLTFLFLCCKFYIHRCKFQNVNPNFSAFKSFLLVKCNLEYEIARKKGKLSQHFKKWSIDL